MSNSKYFRFFLLLITLNLTSKAGLGISLNNDKGLKGSVKDVAWTGGKTINPTLQVFWKYTPGGEDITFRLLAKVTGYVAIGITKYGNMREADMFFGWVSNGVAHVKDCHGPSGGNGAPIPDDEDNIYDVSGKEEAGETEIIFTRKLRTCDVNGQDYDITSDTIKMIFAYDQEKEPGTDGQITSELRHQRENRGHFDTYLLMESPPNPALPGDTIIKRMRARNITIPTDATTYWCDLFKINRATDLGGKKHHLIMSNVIVGGHEEANSPYVHHLILYRCNSFPEGWKEEDERPGGGDCYDGISKLVPRCTQDELIVAWAVGSEPFYYPSNVGFPIGIEETEYFIMEMHYDNPRLESGVIDDSGVTLLLTPTLRTHDAGAIMSGSSSTWETVIPPRMSSYEVEASCHMNCSQTFLPAQGVNVFAGVLHTHLLGTEVTVRLYRGDNELPYILQDKNYDFNYQNIIRLSGERQLMPGDVVTVRCRYDSSNRAQTTFGGLGTMQEMCLTFLFYYPRTNSSLCISTFPSPWNMYEMFNVEAEYHNPNQWHQTNGVAQGPIVTVGGRNTTWTDFLLQHQWTEEEKRQVESIAMEKDRHYYCPGKDGEMGSNPSLSLPPIQVSNPYAPPLPPNCTTDLDGGTSNLQVTSSCILGSLMIAVCALVMGS